MAKKILVVDDHPDLLELMQAKLEAHHFEVLTANSGLEGLEKIAQVRPDMVIVDIMMPGMSGPAMVEVIKQKPEFKDIPCVYLTALLGKEEGVQKKEDQVLLSKECSDDELFKTIYDVLS